MLHLPLEIHGDAARWLAAGALSVLVAVAGYHARSLSADGAIVAIITGTLLVGTAGWAPGALIVLFFVSASALSRVVKGHKTDTGVKGGRRDAWQVFANGGIIVALAVVSTVWNPGSALSPGIIAGISAATADTWATELGRLSRDPPRMITNLTRAEPGTSGAISITGTIAAILGATMISVVAAFMHAAGWWPMPVSAWAIVTIGSLGGVAGALIDSLLGATIQGVWWCDTCHRLTEARIHRCGTQTVLASGIARVNNDAVNALSIAAGAGIAIGVSLVW